LTKRWIDVMNLFGDLTDEQAAAAKQMADQDFADTAAGIEQRRSGALGEREQRRQGERSQAAAVNEATLAEIGKLTVKAASEQCYYILGLRLLQICRRRLDRH